MNKHRSLMTLAVAGLAIALPARADAVILINEVLADPPAGIGDANGDGVVSTTHDEFVEFVNPGSSSVSLAGWMLADLVGVRHLFSSTSVIPALGFFVVFGGGSPSGFANAAVASSGTLSLNNTGDTLTLRSATAQLIDSFTYGAEGGMDVSLTRSPDAVGPFVKHTTVSAAAFSPNRTVDGQSTLPIQPISHSVPEPSTMLLLGFGLLSLRCPRRQ